LHKETLHKIRFQHGFDGLLFISLALAVAEAIADFDRGGSMSISPSNLTGHHEKYEKGPTIRRLTSKHYYGFKVHQSGSRALLVRHHRYLPVADYILACWLAGRFK